MSAGAETPGIKIALAALAAAGAIAAAAFTFLSNKYSVDRPILATQTAEALRATETAALLSFSHTATAAAPTLAPTATASSTPAPTDAPAPAPTEAATSTPTAQPFFTVVNRLGRPATILVNDHRLGEAPAYDARDFTPDAFPVKVEFRVRGPLDASGAGLGETVSGSWTNPADPGDRLILDNKIGDSVYFYLILGNATDQPCRVEVNTGLTDAQAPAMPLPAASERVEYGYYALHPYSTVHLACGESTWYWGRKDAADDGRPLGEQLEPDSGELWLALEP